MGAPRKLLLTVSTLALTACSSVIWDEVNLMPPPAVYGDGMLNPLPEQDPMGLVPYGGLLFATDREPATGDDDSFYRNERGGVLRLGVARISLHESDVDWDEVREISLLKDRPDKYPLRVTGVHEYGILEDTIPGFVRREDYAEDVLDGDEEFAAAVNAQLARSRRKDIYIYVHGFKVVFENPMLVATELWHFLGYDGVMVGYAWPATPSKWAYLKDTDTSIGFARHFRKFIMYLGERTDAERIHIVAFSNGTQMVARAIEQLGLMYHDHTREEIQASLRLGNLILIGSDIDRAVFANYLADGVLNVPGHVAVYVSKKDKALGFSRRLTRRDRLGQMIRPENLTPVVRSLLTESKDHISMIDVSDAEGADTGNGHGYFRNSPWASSDILMTLSYGLTPEQRGLELKSDKPVYEFPPDYIQRLWATLAEVNPDFRRAYLDRQNR
jgi:esterase/lipase superfamily enzyme